jgi:hypothetical protein
MGALGFLHHIGTFLLFSATVLLIITCISAPVVNDLALMKVELGGDDSRSTVTFGTFGYCENNINNSGYVNLPPLPPSSPLPPKKETKLTRNHTARTAAPTPALATPPPPSWPASTARPSPTTQRTPPAP